MSAGDNMTIINISNPVKRNINDMAASVLGNFLSFHMKIRLPTIPLKTVEIAHGSAVTPPNVNLYAPDIIPTGIPTKGPPKRPLIITTRHLTLVGVPFMFMHHFDATSPNIVNMTRHTI